MPRLSGWFVRAALAYLAVGFTLGALILAEKGVSYAPMLWRYLPVHYELLLVGWLIQLALGVAFWILPRFPQGAPRGNEALIWLSFALLNLGIACVVAETVLSIQGLRLVGRAIESGGVLAFVWGSWRRVRPTVV